MNTSSPGHGLWFEHRGLFRITLPRPLQRRGNVSDRAALQYTINRCYFGNHYNTITWGFQKPMAMANRHAPNVFIAISTRHERLNLILHISVSHAMAHELSGACCLIFPYHYTQP